MKKQPLSDIKPEDVEKAKSREGFDIGNDVLYQMCEKYPSHTNEEEIIGKIWLIGRSYAAAIERAIKPISYTEHVGPIIKKYGIELDAQLSHIKKHSPSEPEYLQSMLKTHKFFTDVLYEITAQNKRSLASKYLHFHARNHFYIYDSIVVQNIGAYELTSCREKKEELTKKLTSNEYDEYYLDYIVKAHKLNELLAAQNNGELLTLRALDTLLSEILSKREQPPE